MKNQSNELKFSGFYERISPIKHLVELLSNNIVKNNFEGVNMVMEELFARKFKKLNVKTTKIILSVEYKTASPNFDSAVDSCLGYIITCRERL